MEKITKLVAEPAIIRDFTYRFVATYKQEGIWDVVDTETGMVVLFGGEFLAGLD